MSRAGNLAVPRLQGERFGRFESPVWSAPPSPRFGGAPTSHSPKASAHSLGAGPRSRPAWTRSAPGSDSGGPRGRVRDRRSRGTHAFGCVGTMGTRERSAARHGPQDGTATDSRSTARSPASTFRTRLRLTSRRDDLKAWNPTTGTGAWRDVIYARTSLAGSA